MKIMNNIEIVATMDGVKIDASEAMDKIGGFFLNSATVSYNNGSTFDSYSSVSRVRCSCGNKSINKDHPRICSSCGQKLISVDTLDCSENLMTGDEFIGFPVGENFIISRANLELRPKDKKNPQNPDSLSDFVIEINLKKAIVFGKDKNGSIVTKESASSLGPKYFYGGKGIEEFFGEENIHFMKCGNNYELSDRFFLRQHALNLITIENSKLPCFSDIVYFVRNHCKMPGIDMKFMGPEELFNKLGYPVKYFPLDWKGRANLKISGYELEKWLKSDMGQIICNRILDGEDISSDTINEMRRVSIPTDILLAYMKETADQYGVEKCLKELSLRIDYLKRNCMEVNLENLRTRSFCSMANADKYRIKKNLDGDIDEVILKDPLEVLKSLMVRK